MSDDNKHAKDNAAAWLDSIRDMMGRFDAAVESETGDSQDRVREEIQESPLSIEVREGWKLPGTEGEPEEYLILLSTGGPALRIIGNLGAHNEPETAHLQWQDWFTPWTEYESPDCLTNDSILLKFANQFYFGE